MSEGNSRWSFFAPILMALAFFVLHVFPQRVALGQDSSHQVRLAPPMSPPMSLPNRGSETAGEDGRWYPQALVTLAGTIQQFDADQLSLIKTGDTNPSRYAADRVLEIKMADVPADQQAAMQAFNEARYTDAVKGFVSSVSKPRPADRPPVWRQQWISMMAAQAAFRGGRGEISLEIVQQLDARPMPALIWGLLPIDWTGGDVGNRAVNETLINAAAKRASSESMAVKLVAASWLLRSPKFREAASAAIIRLANQSERKRIAQLAKLLQWRTKNPREIQANWRDWETSILALPLALQTGPLVSLHHHVKAAGVDDAARKLQLSLEIAAPTWHPDLL